MGWAVGRAAVDVIDGSAGGLDPHSSLRSVVDDSASSLVGDFGSILICRVQIGSR